MSIPQPVLIIINGLKMHVLLIHGLARTSLSLLSLERQLKTAGHIPHHFGYIAFAEGFDVIVQRLQQHLWQQAQQGPYAVVAHSLGAILLRAALAEETLSPPCHTVMLGPPNQPPRLAPIAWQFLPFRWVTGQCGANLSSAAFYRTLPALRSPYTIIAGTNGPRGTLSPFGDAVNDGIVALNETRQAATDSILTVPAWHTFMMNHAQVQQLTLTALGESRLGAGI